MTHLLDTCVIIDFVKGDLNTIDRIKSTSPDSIAVSSVTSFELWYGIAKAANLRSKSKSIIEAILQEVELLSFGAKEALIAAEIRNHLRALGTPIGPYDLLIASNALSNDLILVTSNQKEFSRIPNLVIENWRKK